jgi:hypothetical protein
VNVDGLRIRGPKGWPAADALLAERVVIVPSLRSLFSPQFQVYSITIVRPYLSALRTTDGKLDVVPSLLAGAPASDHQAGSSSPGSPRTVSVGRITLRDGTLDFFDATIARPPLKIRVEQIQATVRDVVTPTFTERAAWTLRAC